MFELRLTNQPGSLCVPGSRSSTSARCPDRLTLAPGRCLPGGPVRVPPTMLPGGRGSRRIAPASGAGRSTAHLVIHQAGPGSMAWLLVSLARGRAPVLSHIAHPGADRPRMRLSGMVVCSCRIAEGLHGGAVPAASVAIRSGDGAAGHGPADQFAVAFHDLAVAHQGVVR